MAVTFTFRGDDGAVVAFTELERPDTAGTDVVAGGLLAGDPHLVHQVRAMLSGMTDHVVITPPNVVYHFTQGRDTTADVAAAMLAIGLGRGRLSDQGWQILDPAIGDDPPRPAIF
jgi:hypothetical protein